MKLYSKLLHKLYSAPSNIRMLKSRNIKLIGTCREEEECMWGMGGETWKEKDILKSLA